MTEMCTVLQLFCNSCVISKCLYPAQTYGS